MIFIISLLTSCKTAKTTESAERNKEKSEQVSETHQNEDNKTIINMQADSIVIEEHTQNNNIEPGSENSQTSNFRIPHDWTKRTIKVYGLHKNVNSHNKIVSKEKIQVKEKGNIKTSAKTKEERPSSNGTFIGIVIVLLCLLMITGFVYWKIAVQ